MTRIMLFAALLVLAGCVAAPEVPPMALSSEPVTVTPLAGAIAAPTIAAPGLEAKEPDLCHAIDYVPYLSKPGAVIETLGITRPYRVVTWRGIEPQEYVAGRIVFRLDAAGNIFNIDCG
ncbi:MAG: hypothetical protein Q8Q63_01660 [Phaeovulum sp.]|uniref:hypothetical protein n=1 Tax=Phaeovulum sp. TaxID=2934796 RepID=UPI002732F96C|nr:hypothetical protein [Phaeovulum sp.]MDP3860273.1 hypothetical protein [Phaeovulum sp.]